MRARRRVLTFVLLACLFLGFPTKGMPQDCQRGFQRFPCFVDWTKTLTDPMGAPHVSQPTIGVAANRDLLVPGVLPLAYPDGPVQYSVYRRLYRFTPAGSEVPNLNGGPWFSAEAYDTKEIPWQRLTVDTEHNRLFVLFAQRPSGSSGTVYNFFLAAHDLQTGDKLASWGGTKFVGTSLRPLGGLAVDSSGNPLTVLETVHGQLGFEVKRWDGQNGNNVTPNITPPHDYIWDSSSDPATDRHFVALGIRNVDNRIYLAYSETRGVSVTKDLVVTLWDSSLQFLDRKEFFEALPAPPGLPGVASDATAHPVFTEGLATEEGDMSIGGLYAFEGWVGEGQPYFAFPILFRFGTSPSPNTLSVEWKYTEKEHYVLNANGILLANASEGTAWLIPSNHTFGDVPVFGVSATGTLARFTYFRNPFGENAVEDPQGSGCYYQNLHSPAAIVAGRSGPVMSGYAQEWLFSAASQPACPVTVGFQSFVTSYYNGLRLVCCILRPFEWAQALPMPHSLGMSLHARLIEGARNDESAMAVTEPLRFGSVRRATSEAAQYNILPILHDVRILVERPHPVESFGGLLERLATALEKAPVGHAFDKGLQTGAVGSLRDVHTAGRLTSAVRAKLVESANALALDQQVAALAGSRGIVATGGSPAAREVAWMTPAESAKPGTVLLSARLGVPALAEGFEPAWPVATYHIEFAGEMSEKRPILVGFKAGEFGFGREVNAVRVFEWDGKSYRDITEAAEARKGYVTGRITRRSTDLVLMGVPTGLDTASRTR